MRAILKSLPPLSQRVELSSSTSMETLIQQLMIYCRSHVSLTVVSFKTILSLCHPPLQSILLPVTRSIKVGLEGSRGEADHSYWFQLPLLISQEGSWKCYHSLGKEKGGSVGLHSVSETFKSASLGDDWLVQISLKRKFKHISESTERA